jgi:adenosylcobinamide-phosphate synthase
MVDLCAAVIIDWILGDPYWFPHPVIYIGKLIKFLENKGRSVCKTPKALKVWGGLIVIIVCFVSFLIPFTILRVTRSLPWLYHGLNIFMLWTTLAARSLHKEGIKVYHSLEREDLGDARLKLSYIVGRDTKNLSSEEIIRADVETIAENTSDGIIAPLFFAALGGAPLSMLYKGVNTMDSMLGYLNEKYRHIGFFPAKTDDVFNFIPARITGFLMCISAPVVNGNIIRSLRIMVRDRKNHKSPNCAYPEAAVAGAMDVQLGGSNTYFGEVMAKPTIGDAVKKLTRSHISDTIRLMYSTEILFILVYIAIILGFNR